MFDIHTILNSLHGVLCDSTRKDIIIFVGNRFSVNGLKYNQGNSDLFLSYGLPMFPFG